MPKHYKLKAKTGYLKGLLLAAAPDLLKEPWRLSRLERLKRRLRLQSR